MRKLTEREIAILEEQGCWAENWECIEVDDVEFRTDAVKNVRFYGNVSIGSLAGSIEVEEGFTRCCGVRNATLRNVSLADGCLVENVMGYISNYDIADGVLISNVGIISTQGTPQFGNGTVASVLNEGGDGNVVIYDRLTAQTAHLMMDNECVRRMVLAELEERPRRERGTIGRGSRIVGTREISNVVVGDACEIQGASRLSDCTIRSCDEAPTLIGSDVIMENTVVSVGATVADGAKLSNSFVGESTHVGKGFSSESSLFFANGHFDNGEACAAFCGPFACSHHKSTLLIGGQFSFYNAGSGTNQSNHAYKMGPIHYGVLQRGSKTASGSHILWPATIGSFSMVMGKLTEHPNLTKLPFSYVMATGEKTYIVPGVNIRTVGTWRDVNKWPKRDLRPRATRSDLINFAFPNPYIIQHVIEGRRLLEDILAAQTAEEYEYEGCIISHRAVVNGIRYYDLAINLFLYQVLNSNHETPGETGVDRWLDVSGMLAPEKEIERILADINSGAIATTDELLLVLQQVNADYPSNVWDYAQNLMQQLSGSLIVNLDQWLGKAEEAHEQWLRMVRNDAEHEFQLGDVDEDHLRNFLETIK